MPSVNWRPYCRTSPVVIVVDELPWLAEQDELFDGALQTAWDRLLSRQAALLLLLGSDLHMMERLTAYDRPFFGRADNLLLGPLNPAEVGARARPGGSRCDRCAPDVGRPARDPAGVAGGHHGASPSLRENATIRRRRCSACRRRRCWRNSPCRDDPPGHRGDRRRRPDVRQHRCGGGQPDWNRSHPARCPPSCTGWWADKHVLAADEPLSVRAGKAHAVPRRRQQPSLPGRSAALPRSWSRRGRPAPVEDADCDGRWASWRGRAVEPVIREACRFSAGDFPGRRR